MSRPRKTAPDATRVVAYLRVSTQEQTDSGAGIAAQRHAIEAEAERKGWTVVAWCEDSASGKTVVGREGFADALARIRAGEAGALVAAKLDRLFRSLQDFADLMAQSHDEGWSIIALDLGVDTSTPAGEFMASVMASAARWERRIIGQRTKDALAVKISEGVHCGRPRELPADVVARIMALRSSGASMAAIANTLTAEGVPTARGGAKWSPSTIQTVLRAEAKVRRRDRPAEPLRATYSPERRSTRVGGPSPNVQA